MRAHETHWARNAITISASARLRRRYAWKAASTIAGMPSHQITVLPAS